MGYMLKSFFGFIACFFISTPLLAQNPDPHHAVSYPFIEYSDPEGRSEEAEVINFFEYGRSLTLIGYGGYEAMTFNISHLYGDSRNFLGAAISFFFDLNFALQVEVNFPRYHYNSLTDSEIKFMSYNLNFKYYLNKQYLVKDISQLNPYIILGPFWLGLDGYDSYKIASNTRSLNAPPNPSVPSVALDRPQLSPDDGEHVDPETVFDLSYLGMKIGLGIEIPIMKKTFIGLELAYLYSPLFMENEDLSQYAGAQAPSKNPRYDTWLQKRIYPNKPENVQGWRAFGDMATATVLLGVNF